MDVIDRLGELWKLPVWVCGLLVFLYYLSKILPAIGAAGKGIGRVWRKYRARQRLSGPADESWRKRRLTRLAADQLERLLRIDHAESWSDARFTELEAEVETDVPKRSLLRLVKFRGSARSGTGQQPRREASLTDALMKTDESIVFLHGEPGSGKSVALRRVARNLARKAARGVGEKTRIPLYINLKTLDPGGGPVDPALIRSFVLDSLNERATLQTEEVLKEEFEPGLLSGRWLFLFDSFDEIPAVMASTELDDEVERYSDAIRGFLGENQSECRAVIASRDFKAPPDHGWPTFTIVRLSPKRQRELVRQLELKPSAEDLLLKALPDARDDVAQLARGPMFLALLASFVERRGEFPTSTTDVWEEFIDQRLSGDDERLRKQALSSERVRRGAEEIAFTIMASGSSLNTTCSSLLARRMELDFSPVPTMRRILDALVRMRLAKYTDPAPDAVGDPRFEFLHRRLQEYFTTTLLLRDPGRFDEDLLLFDDRWRETAVTLCQARSGYVQPLLEKAATFLRDAVDALPEPSPAGADRRERFDWPPKVLHVLALIQSAFPAGAPELSADLRRSAGTMVHRAYDSGWSHHRRAALDVAGPLASADLENLVRDGLTSGSSWLRDGAYQQIGRLRTVDAELAVAIRQTLLALMGDRALRRDRTAQEAQLSRLANPLEFLRGSRTLWSAQLVDALAHVALAMIFVATAPTLPQTWLMVVILLWSHLALFDIALAQGAAIRPSLTVARKTSRAYLRQAWAAVAEVVRRPGTVISRVRASRARLPAPLASSPQGFVPTARIIARMCVTVTLLLFVVGAFATIGETPTSVVVAAVALFILQTWGLAAIAAVRVGSFLSPYDRVFAHAAIVKFVLTRLASVNWPLIRVWGVGVVLYVVLALAAQQIDVNADAASTVAAISFGALIAVFACAGVVHVWRHQGHDWRWYRKRDFNTAMSQAEMMHCLASMRSAWGILAVMSAVRRRDLLREADDASALLMDLQEAATFELVDSTVEWHLAVPEWRTERMKQWVDESPKGRLSLLRTSGPDFVDETGRLLQMQYERDRQAVIV